MRGENDIHDRVPEYWSWLAAAVFLLTTVDLLTTLSAGATVGFHAEANPLIRWVIRYDLTGLVLMNLTAIVLVALLFARVTHVLRETPTPTDRYLALAIEIWLGVLLATGLFVFANNLAVIVHAQSLIPA